MLLAVGKKDDPAEDDVDGCCEEGRCDEEEDGLHNEGAKGPDVRSGDYAADVS